MEAIKHEYNKGDEFASVLVKDGKRESWLDLAGSNDDLAIEWNQYIFHTNCIEDVEQLKY